MKKTPTKEQQEYRHSEEFQNHDFGGWDDSEGWCLHCVDPVTKEHYHHSAKDDRIMSQAGCSDDEYDDLRRNSPAAQRNKQMWKNRDEEERYKHEHRIAIVIAQVVRGLFVVIFFLPSIIFAILDKIWPDNIVSASVFWMFGKICSFPFVLIGPEAVDYYTTDAPPRFKKKNKGGCNDDDDIDYDELEKLFHP